MATEGEDDSPILPAFGDYAKAAPPAGTLTADEKQWGMFCHLSSLLGFMVAGMSFLGPLACWLVKRETSRFVDDQGKESLNFQLNILVLFLISIPIAVCTAGIGVILTIAVIIYGGVMAVIAGVKAGEGVAYRYPATVRVIK